MSPSGDLQAENEHLRRRLAEAEEALQAISDGRVDAIVVDGGGGARIFSLSGADHIYRVLVETMREVGLTTGLDGTILFCNERFCELMRAGSHQVLGRPLAGFIAPEYREEFSRLLADVRRAPVQRRLVLLGLDGCEVPVQASLNLLEVGDEPSICVVAADLTDLEASQRSIDHLHRHQLEMEEVHKALRQAHAAALNLMEDAVIVRRQAEDSHKAMRESEERYRVLAAENERLYRQQLDIADQLQLALLTVPSAIGRLRVDHVYHSATEAARVGGDFYDVYEARDGQVVMLIGDVSGHGVPAARTATLVTDVVHAFSHQTLEPDEVLNRTNRLLIEKGLEGFVTLFLGVLDTTTGELVFSSAGHPLPMIRRASGRVDVISMSSYPLGVFSGSHWQAGHERLAGDDLMLLYTDGLTEARRGPEFFGERRLAEALLRDGAGAERLAHRVVDAVMQFADGNLQDDVAVLAVTLSDSADIR